MSPLLSIKEISHVYFTKESIFHALQDVSFSVKEGEFVSILGPSGCGKTTLLSIISGLVTPTQGTVLINESEVCSKHSSIGYMLQQDYLFPWKTIKQNVLLGLNILHDKRKESINNALNLLNEMGLSKVEDAYPRQLSGGMRQRAALARTLATNPSVLLLDEPFSALDYQTKLKLENLVVKTLKEYDKTAILVTHDIEESIAMSDRIILLSKQPGRIAKNFTVPQELKTLTPFQARRHPLFPSLFHSIWKELEALESV